MPITPSGIAAAAGAAGAGMLAPVLAGGGSTLAAGTCDITGATAGGVEGVEAFLEPILNDPSFCRHHNQIPECQHSQPLHNAVRFDAG